MDALYDSLQRRLRPEDVAQLILDEHGHRLTGTERALVDRAARGSLVRQWLGFTSMSQDWKHAVGLDRQLARASVLFERAPVLAAGDADVPERIEAFLDLVEPEIQKVRGQSDFKDDRLNRGARKAVGITISRRKYNRRFRMLARIEARLSVLRRELVKRRLERVAKIGLVVDLDRARFVRSPSAAVFVAYLTAKKAKRSVFTVWGQERPFDEIGAMLLERCRKDPSTDWMVVAHAWPTSEVLAHLTDLEKGELLSAAFRAMGQAADLLEETFRSRPIDRSSMVVRRGDDSSTWNHAAGAFNAARDAWIGLTHAAGAYRVLEAMCVPKAMRLVAGDVAAWHRHVGHRGDPNVAVAAALPTPWSVLRGEADCTADEVRHVCALAGLDPERTGWVGPRATGPAVPFRATPELVHGVAISSPVLAAYLKKADVFSGKPKLPGVDGLVAWLAKVGRS